MNSLILMAAMFAQCQGGSCTYEYQIQPPPVRYRVQIQKIQPQYTQPRIQQNVNYLTPLRTGDVLIPQRVGLFGWRTEYKLYRNPYN